MKRHRGPIHLASNTLPRSLVKHELIMQTSDLWTVKGSHLDVNYHNSSAVQQSSVKAANTFHPGSYMKRNDISEVSVLFDRQCSMHFVSRPYLLLGQCFGLIPVCGIFSDDPRDLKFEWKAKRMLYALSTLVVALMLAAFQIVQSIRTQGLSQSTADVIVGQVVYAVTIVIFLCQARSWRKLIVEWTKVERQMRHIRPALQLDANIRRFVYAFVIGTVLMIVGRAVGTVAGLSACSRDWAVLLQLAVVRKYSGLFAVTRFSVAKAAVACLLFLHENVVAVYDELTLVVLAYCLRERFKQLCLHLLTLKKQKLPISYWAQMRVTYNELSSVAKSLDGHLSCMTLVCFGANLYHICSLLLLSLKSESGDKWVNWCLCYVVLFLMGRTYVAALAAASVHEQSKAPLLALLFSVPSDSYNAEVCRFQMQVTHDEITLTGCHFFSLTRSFMLTVAGTIMTYEIVLLQFGSLGDNVEASFNQSACAPLLTTLNNQ